MIVTAVAVVTMWGALAFGAVYPWAYTPLLAVCATIGALGLLIARQRRFGVSNRRAIAALVCVLGAVCLQLVPLPVSVLRAVSPSTDEFLRHHDLQYAIGAPMDGQAASDDAGAPAVGAHPLSIAPRATLRGLGFLTAFTLFLAGLLRALTRTDVRRLAALIVTFGVLLALFGIVQKMILGDHAWGGMKIYGFWTPERLLSTPFGPYVNKNHFAGWMLMALPVAAGLAMGLAEERMRKFGGGWRSALLWLSSPSGGRLQLILMGSVVMGASVLMTKSRSGLGGLIIAIILLGVVARRRFRSARAGFAVGGGLAAVVLIAFALAGADITARLQNRGDDIGLRKNIWTDSAAIVRDFPVTGTGLNTFGTAMVSYQTSQRDQHFQEAHNDYLQVLVEGGLLVVVPAVIALVLIAWAIARRFASGEDDARMYWVRAGATTGLAAIAAQAFVEFSLQMPGNAALFVVLLAMAMHQGPHERSEVVAPRSTHP